jgi:c(7)-type cytochrome triheme protein
MFTLHPLPGTSSVAVLGRLRHLGGALLLIGAGASAAPAQEAPAHPADEIHDSTNPAHFQLQSPAEGLRGLPLDKRGAVDWAQALRSGAIAPRGNLDGTQAVPTLELDVILKNTKEMPYVRFGHKLHTQWLACSNCHDALFVPKAGANRISMDAIFRGNYCGACHGRVAFVPHFACERCHSVPQNGAKAWW